MAQIIRLKNNTFPNTVEAWQGFVSAIEETDTVTVDGEKIARHRDRPFFIQLLVYTAENSRMKECEVEISRPITNQKKETWTLKKGAKNQLDLENAGIKLKVENSIAVGKLLKMVRTKYRINQIPLSNGTKGEISASSISRVESGELTLRFREFSAILEALKTFGVPDAELEKMRKASAPQ